MELPGQALGARERDGCRSLSGSRVSPIGFSLLKQHGAEVEAVEEMDKVDLIASL